MTKKARILAVDDEKALCHLLALNLEDAGFDVTEAYSGNEAMRLIDANQFDLVISDIRMPDGDGIELLTRLKNKDPCVPVVLFITAFADITMQEAYHLGAEAFFKKPVKYDQLIAKVEECLKKKPDRWLKRERIDAEFSIDVSFDNFQTVVSSHIFNIGQGGFFLKMDGSIPLVNQCLEFKLVFLDGKYSPIRGKGICRWRRDDESSDKPKGIGVEFIEIDQETHGSILALMQDLKLLSYIPIA